jgi:hypothetical protein
MARLLPRSKPAGALSFGSIEPSFGGRDRDYRGLVVIPLPPQPSGMARQRCSPWALSPIPSRQRFPKSVVFYTAKCSGDKMQDLEKMAAKLLETARKLPPGAEQHALLEQITTFRIKLSAIAAKRKELQSS